jgi:hypothetical protein
MKNEQREAVEVNEDALSLVMKMVNKLLEDGITPPDITYVLTYVAADLGLRVTDGNLSPIQVLNAAISHAVGEAVMRQNSDSSNRVDSEDANAELLEAPASCAIH